MLAICNLEDEILQIDNANRTTSTPSISNHSIKSKNFKKLDFESKHQQIPPQILVIQYSIQRIASNISNCNQNGVTDPNMIK